MAMEAAFLMAVTRAKDPLDENYVPVAGAPIPCLDPTGATCDCDLSIGCDPPVNMHPGMMVFRSGIEVRMDEASMLRVGSPTRSIQISGENYQNITGDNKFMALQLHAYLGVEIGGGDERARVREKVQFQINGSPEASTVTDPWGLGKYGRPLLLARDVEIDGCSLPKSSGPAVINFNSVTGRNSTDAYTDYIYNIRLNGTDCVSRIGIIGFPGESSAEGDKLGRYPAKDGEVQAEKEYKELYISTDNFIDFDRRSRVKVGGIFFDGLGAQPYDQKNAFSETYSWTEDWLTPDGFDPMLGDKKNTIRGDSELHINGGLQGGNVTITGGSSRYNNVRTGSVIIRSGTDGMVGTWSGDTGEIEIHSAKAGVVGSSGDFNSSTGDATEGTSGGYIFKTGYSDAGGSSGGFLLTTGYARGGRAGGFHLYTGLTSGPGQNGADVDMHAGDTAGATAIGGHVEIVAGDGLPQAASVTGGAGGHMLLEAGSGLGSNVGYGAHGGDIFMRGGNSTANLGGDIIIHTGETLGTISDLLDSAASSGSLFLRTPSIPLVDNFGYTGSINMGTGDSHRNEAGYVDIYAGSSLNQGAEVNITAGAAHNDQTFTEGDIEGGHVFITGGSAYNSVTQGTGGNITLEAGLALKYGGHLMLYAGDAITADVPTDQPTYSQSLNRVGGRIHMESGHGALKHSGSILINTPHGGTSGGAGNVTISTGDSNTGVDCGNDGGATCIGGNITVHVGYNTLKHGASFNLTGGNTKMDHGKGGPIVMDAGDGELGVGGNVRISGGAGLNNPKSINAPLTQANNPDWVQFGLADSQLQTNGYGGNVTLVGGESTYDHGGSVNLRSGLAGSRTHAMSGNITLITEDACDTCVTGTVTGPLSGRSGNVELLTGEGSLYSGNISLTTGIATKVGGSSGNITLLAGESLYGDGGHINITAGRGKSLLEGGSGGTGGGDARLDDGDLWLNAGRKVEVKGDYGTEILGGDALDRTFKEVCQIHLA